MAAGGAAADTGHRPGSTLHQGFVPADRWFQAVAAWTEGLEWRRTGAGHALHLQLVPERLGPLHVEIAHEAGGLAARILVFQTDTLALIHRHLDDLHQALAARGLSLRQLDVGLGFGDGSYGGPPGGGFAGHGGAAGHGGGTAGHGLGSGSGRPEPGVGPPVGSGRGSGPAGANVRRWPPGHGPALDVRI